MAPPTTKPRLSRLDPAELARDIEDEVVHHLHRLAFTMGPGVEVVIQDRREGVFTQIGTSVHDLARYARGDAPLDAPVHEYLVTLLDVLSPPLGGAGSATGLDAALSGSRDVDELSSSPLDRLALVACAALGRECLDRGHPIAAAWLAALGSVSTDRIHGLASAGELDRNEGGAITAESAKRWLASRRPQNA